MATAVINKEFDVLKELEKIVSQNLIQSFGLDFILLEDKYGGDVDTVHNVRQGVFATEKEKNIYENRSEYDSHKYHTDKRYKEHNKFLSEQKDQGELVDKYTNEKFNNSSPVNLDHIISANEGHNDPGVSLAGLDPIDLVNQKSNFAPTHQAINKSKNASSMSDFVDSMNQKLANKRETLAKLQEKLKNDNLSINEQQNLEKKIKNAEEYIKAFESADKEKMRALDKKAREIYNAQVNHAYYTSSKFFKNTALQAGKKSLQMGGRQALGIVIAEIWFELKEQVPMIYQNCKTNFKFEIFLEQINTTLENIFKRIRKRFHDLLVTFKDGVLGGIISSLHTTLINIFTTTTKIIGKLIREMWNNLVKVAKLAFFNPDNLSSGDLLREILKLISFGLSVAIGTMINSQLSTYLTIPFGDEIATFLSGLLSGVLMLGFTYFLEHSEIMNKVWNFLNHFKDKCQVMIDHMKEINQELDHYLIELSKIEFNLNTEELNQLSMTLSQTNDELMCRILLIQEAKKRNIYLEYDLDEQDGFKNHLKQLQNKCHGK
ncbi:cobalamin adenosyltransferase [Aggregatibacter kilianii]|uniref:cobalamin adenosyltransferase n=1 Tax=Aggregatibacter kilianii TaxID=2025884 RepID=UPI000D6879E3|nr:cobalamin adenosyltransferase [Aggregatibacter kilianii]